MARTSTAYGVPGAPVDMDHMTRGVWWYEGAPTQAVPGMSRWRLTLYAGKEQGQMMVVAVVEGGTAAECLANAQLMVDVSAALNAAMVAKNATIPPPGTKVEILVDEPNDAPLKKGQIVMVAPDPDGETIAPKDTVWVADGDLDDGLWALDPEHCNKTWKVLDDDGE